MFDHYIDSSVSIIFIVEGLYAVSNTSIHIFIQCKKVILLEYIDPCAIEVFTKKTVSCQVLRYEQALSGEKLINLAADAKLLGMRSKTHWDFFSSYTIGWHAHR